jgi:homocysteine S-methyltransferase
MSSLAPPPASSFTLLDWFRSATTPLSSTSSSTGSTGHPYIEAEGVAPFTPAVLLMDGGVSTHLEGLIAPRKFFPRSLWSSSLLLTPAGRASIVRGHRDWLAAGVDVVTTVTYQCHYGLVPPDGGEAGDPPVENNDTGSDTGNNDDDIDTVSSIDEERMTKMINDGIALARQAILPEDVGTTGSNDDGDDVLGGVYSQRSTSSSPGPYVVASTGPYGAAMADGSEYTGRYPPSVTVRTLRDFHRKKARTLLQTKPDGLAVETIPNLDEVGVVCQVLKDLLQEQEEKEGSGGTSSPSPPIACWISFACRNGYELNDGHTVKEALEVVRSHDPDGRWISAVGVNCCDSAHIQSLVKILTEDIAHSRKGGGDGHDGDGETNTHSGRRGIILYPNSGEAWDAAHEEWKDGTGTTDMQFADRLMDAVRTVQDTWDEAYPKLASSDKEIPPPLPSMPKIILGGCCRTNPATIATLRRRIDEWNKGALEKGQHDS